VRRFPGISKTLIKSLVGKPATLNYPQQKRMYTPATRGKVENEIERCIFCRMCERNCPTSALSVSKERNEWEIDSLKCCQCRRCVEVCPVKCLSMDNVYFPSVRTRAEGKYLRVLPPGVLPAYQKAKEAAAKSREVKTEKPEASQVVRNENGGTNAGS
jgi:formate hydrogenlyase subunit 6/NADH:ubiquinone oxidoreductase subunit I